MSILVIKDYGTLVINTGGYFSETVTRVNPIAWSIAIGIIFQGLLTLSLTFGLAETLNKNDKLLSILNNFIAFNEAKRLNSNVSDSTVRTVMTKCKKCPDCGHLNALNTNTCYKCNASLDGAQIVEK